MIQHDSYICGQCVGDPVLRDEIMSEGAFKQCCDCDESRKSITIEALAERIDPVFREYYAPGGWGWSSQDGESPQIIIQNEAEVGEEVATAIVDYLHGEEYRSVKHGADPMYDPNSCYVEQEFLHFEHHESWDQFCQRIKQDRRLIDEYDREFLEDLLSELEEISENQEDSPVVVVGPEDDSSIMYRARCAKSLEEAAEIAKGGAQSLGPPPVEKALANRMNAAGIRVFYGGSNEEVCIAEVRPSVGGWVVVGQFIAMRELKFLDLTRLWSYAGSKFAGNYMYRLDKMDFLQKFHLLVSRPIQPHEEQLEYVPTQVLAEYLVSTRGFDGLIYASAQLGRLGDKYESEEQTEPKHKNVVMFNSSEHLEICQAEISPTSSAGVTAIEGLEGFPGLRYVQGSAEIIHITGMNVEYERRSSRPYWEEMKALEESWEDLGKEDIPWPLD